MMIKVILYSSRKCMVIMVGAMQLLDAVGCGVDIFDTAYSVLATEAGYALTFPIPSQPAYSREDMTTPEPDLMLGADDTKMNVWAEAYRRDPSPLLKGCDCFTCRNHSRAYVHHLLMSHEMLAHVLLEMHNTHHMLCFMRALQNAIEHGKLADFRKRLMELKPLTRTT